MQTPLSYFFDSGQRLFLPYLLSSAVLALLFLYSKKIMPTATSLKHYWFNKSARLDYYYFVVIWAIKLLLILPFLLSTKTVALYTLQIIEPWVIPQFNLLSYEAIAICYAASIFLVSDFTRYWLHRWMHKSDFLWQFHQVHHSAESLNPITFYRVHPVENVLFGLRYALSVGVVTGVFVAFFGAKLNLHTIIGVNFLQVIFSFVGANLRHSSIFLSYGKLLEYFFISPAQHQLHHDVQHMQKNYGGYLAIWDYCFGSLQKASGFSQPLTFGLGTNHCFTSVLSCLYLPFYQAYKKVVA